jgi:hypothetical protein
MEIVIMIVIIAGALSVIISGVWVAIALIIAISAPRARSIQNKNV